MSMFRKEVNEFCDRLRKRGAEKRQEAFEEYDKEEKAKRIAESPGGVDPQEVYDSLPEVFFILLFILFKIPSVVIH